MSEPYLGEIRLMSFNYAPKGWALCNGQFLPINQNQALFALLGTMYGGNGQTTFALPDLRGRTPIHASDVHTQGESAGQEVHTLNASETPTHTHLVAASSAAGTTNDPTNNYLASPLNQIYRSPQNITPAFQALLPSTLSSIGGNQPHENRQPFLTLSFCIALQGIFPSQN